MNELKMEQCLYSKWNGNTSQKDAKDEIKKLLSQRKPKRLFSDLVKKAQEIGIKTMTNDVFVVTCALFCRGTDTEEEILEGIQEMQLDKLLFIGFRVFLCNKRKKHKFTISWTDKSFPNLHEWISRFSCEFYNLQYRELFCISNLLYKMDPSELWQIAKDDPNDLILLNWIDIFGALPSKKQILELLDPKQSCRRHALAFWWLTFSISIKDMEETAHNLLSQIEGVVANEIIVPCIYEFLLSEHICPQAFITYLQKSSFKALLRHEIERENLFGGWQEINNVANLIDGIGSEKEKRFLWNSVICVIEKKLKSGFLNYQTDNNQLFLSKIPTQQRIQLEKDIKDWISTLHTEEIDYLVRPSVYRQDVALKSTAQMVLDRLGISNC